MIKKKTYNDCSVLNKHDYFLIKLPKIAQQVKYFKVLYSPKDFRNELLSTIAQAYNHIYLVTLYLENDLGGKTIIDAILHVKKLRPQLKIKIIVDWHRAQRARIGELKNYTNIDWYNDIMCKHSYIDYFSIYGVPININEALGVLHLKGFIIDDKILYSGANLSSEYLHIDDKYRYDRYHVINNSRLSQVMLKYIDEQLLISTVISEFKDKSFLKKSNKNKNNIRLFRKKLRNICYDYEGDANFNEFSITPLVGLGKKSILNQVINHLIFSVKHDIILCTPYFNIPNFLVRSLIYLLRSGKNVEIIVGAKIANDFYNPNQECKPFNLISIIPYLYEVNLRYFSKKLQYYIDNKQLKIRLWENGIHGYHIKGIWIDKEWQLLTGSNLNPRALRFDLENALLVHDPLCEFTYETNKELEKIRFSTNLITHYTSIQKISDYPFKIRKLMKRIRKIRFDKLIYQLL